MPAGSMWKTTSYHDNLKAHLCIETKVNEVLRDTGIIKTLISLIFHSGKHLNQSLREGNYFFKDIKKEGIVLYDTGRVRLSNFKKLTAEETRQKAQDYFDQWYIRGIEFLETFEFEMGKERFHNAAFLLHQVTERYYTLI